MMCKIRRKEDVLIGWKLEQERCYIKKAMFGTVNNQFGEEE